MTVDRNQILQIYKNPQFQKSKIQTDFWNYDDQSYKMNHRDDHDIPCNTHLTIGFKFCDQQICDGYFFGEGLAIFSVVVCEILLKKIMHLTKNQAQKIIKNFQQFLLNQEYDKLLLDDLNMFAPLVHSNQIDAAMMPVKIILEGLN